MVIEIDFTALRSLIEGFELRNFKLGSCMEIESLYMERPHNIEMLMYIKKCAKLIKSI